MTAPAAPLLVIAPHATRTGSTRVLLDLLTAARPALGRPLRVEVLTDGPHRAALEALGPPAGGGVAPGVVLVNTCLAADRVLGVPAGVATAVYVHESADTLGALPEAGREGLRRATLLLCVSEAVRADVVALGVDPGSTVVLPPLVSVPTTPGAAAVDAARRAAGAAPGERLVLGCGEASWRKGADLFVAVGRHLLADRGVRLGWVGRRLRPFSSILDHDVAATGLGERVRWLGEVADPTPLLAAADVLLVPSRHDPQPLVALEAALVGTPTVGFATGGLARVAAAGGAVVVPYPDVEALAAGAAGLLDAPDRAAAVAAAGATWARERQSAEVVVPQFVALMTSLGGAAGA